MGLTVQKHEMDEDDLVSEILNAAALLGRTPSTS
jgi:hypothetical protein